MILIVIDALLMLVSLYLIFIWVPPAAILGETSRIVYLHVPLAWVATLAFIVAGLAAIHYIRKNTIQSIHFARSSVHIGFFFSILTVITGSLWAKVMWGSYWNWDPRETSITLLLLMYIAYFSLHHVVRTNPKGAMLESVYLVMALVASPFLIFIVPRLYPSLHPEPVINTQGKILLDTEMRMVLLVSVAAFTLLYIILMKILFKIHKLDYLINEDES